MSAELLLASVSALAAVASAVAAWRAHQHAKTSGKTAETAALLGRLPLPVPWIDRASTSLRVVNRGVSTAHNMRWTITVGGEQLADGEYAGVLNPGSSASLTDAQHSIVGRVTAAQCFLVSCEFSTSWGERFRVQREYEDGKSADPVLLDSEGTPISLLG